MKTCFVFIDIGNTAVDLKVCQDDSIHYFKIRSDDFPGLESFFSNLEDAKIFVAYVRKDTKEFLVSLFEKRKFSYRILTPEVMESHARKIRYQVNNLSYLGHDLFCDIVSLPSDKGLIVIDLGTASKVLFVRPNRVFEGASIFPGLMTFGRSLGATTSLLRDVPILPNPPVVSLKTEECISSGAIYGTAGAILSIVKKIKEDYDTPSPLTVLTGGNALYVQDILKENRLDFQLNEHSVLDGLTSIFEEETKK